MDKDKGSERPDSKTVQAGLEENYEILYYQGEIKQERH